MLKIIADSLFGVFNFATTNDEVAGCSEADFATDVVGEMELTFVPGDHGLYILGSVTTRGEIRGRDLLSFD